jgi:lipid-A-disaccharide synthase
MRLFFSVGEPSGDLHGSNLIRALREREPSVECVGYGGPLMHGAGFRQHYDLCENAIMGFSRAIAAIPRMYGLLCKADRYFREHRPDAVVMIDYPGFNWHIARRAKAHGIPVFYYGVPQIWAWASWRVNKLRRYVDHALCKLPFEEKWFRERGVNATHVGHPFFDQLRAQKLDEAFIAEQHAKRGRLITILPGSRNQELTYNFPSYLKAAKIIRERVSDVRFAVAAYKPKHAEQCTAIAKQAGVALEVYSGRTQELMSAAHSCLASSGSVSLELLYHLKPTAIQYRVSYAAYKIGTSLATVPYMTLVNLLVADDIAPPNPQAYDPDGPDADKALYPEYPTYRDKSPFLARHIIEWLTDDAKHQRLIGRLRELREQVGHGGASQRACEYILRELGRQNSPRLLGESPPAPRRAA